jgi:hypothetical protein
LHQHQKQTNYLKGFFTEIIFGYTHSDTITKQVLNQTIKMKRIVLLLLLFTSLGFSQVGVNTTTPDPSSMLDVSATNKGALFPRVSLSNVTLTTLDGTNTAATGLLIWNTNATTTGGNGVGYYYFNGTIWVPVVQTGANDHDWYEVGTTIAPNAITDNMFHTGNIAIGKNTIDALSNPKLDIENNTSGSTVLKLRDVSTGTTLHTGINLDMQSTSTATEYGIAVRHNNANSGLKYGVYSTVENGSGNNTAFQGRVTGTGTNSGLGLIIFDSGSASTASQFAITTEMRQSTTNSTAGLRNGFTSNNLALDTGSKFGVQNIFGSIGTNVGGDLYGVYNYFESNLTSTTNKYGTYTIIPSVIGGTHYGIYSNVLKSGSFAGYFLGNVSIGTNAGNNYILPPSRGTNGQTMQTDGSGNVSWVTPASATDSDWFELGTTTTANAITDNIYTQGKVSVGSSTLSSGKLNVYNSLDSNSFYSENTGSPTVASSSGYFSNTGIGAFTRYGIQTTVSGGGSGQKFGIFNNISTSSTDWQTGVFNFMSGSNASLVYGFRSDISTTGSSSQRQYGLFNDFSTVSDSEINGVYNSVSSSGNGIHYGTHNRITGNGNGLKYGTYNLIVGTGTGIRYGNYNYISGSGTNIKYGTYNLMDPLAGGTHYGMYSETLKIGSYAGYFLGNVSIGTTTTNNYILPPSRGANGQTIQTDATGNLTWVNPPTDTDDQTTDVFSLTGNTLNLSIQNDGVATQTVDLSSLQDADWYEIGGITPANSINDNIYTIGDVVIGKATPALAKLDVQSNAMLNTLSLTNTNTSIGTKNGIENSIDMNVNNNNSNAFKNNITGLGNIKNGIYTFFGEINPSFRDIGLTNDFRSSAANSKGVWNFFSPPTITNGIIEGLVNQMSNNNITGQFRGVFNDINNNTNGTQIGIINGFSGGGSGTRTGVSTSISNATGDMYGSRISLNSVGAGTKYGDFIEIDNTSGGTHYGIYSDVTKSNSFAGFFLGRMSIGTTTTDNYILPLSRGTANQVMQTDGSGNVSWVNAPNSDADWYEVGGTNPPNSILDNIYTGGDVSIGKNTAAIGKLDIESTNKNTSLYLVNNNPADAVKIGINNNVLTGNDNNAATGISNYIGGQTNKSAISNLFLTNNPGPSISETAITNSFFSNGNLVLTGIANSVSPPSPSNNPFLGFSNSISTNCGGSFGGLQNTTSNNTASLQQGVVNNFFGAGTGARVGVSNALSNSAGTIHGILTSISSAGNGNKFGEQIYIDDTSGGTHYGIYSDVIKANSYAGYFLGRMSIGTNGANNYILPLSRGTNGQIMQTDGVGNASWVNPNAISWSLTGNAGTTAGTNFIGTTDTQDLDFRTNNQLKLRVTQQGQLSFLNSGASVFIGTNAGDVDDLTNNQNTFVGSSSGQLNTTGSLNTAIGNAALNINVSGVGNTAIGKSALITNDLGSNNSALGRLADVSTGSLTNATAIGFNATVNASNKVRIGSVAVTVIEGQVAYTFPSDARFKFNIKENVPGLDFIKKLKPVTYNFDTKKFDEHLNQNRKSETLETDYSKSTALIHTGFLAQDIEKICADLGYDFDGLHIPDPSNPTDNYSVAYSQFIMPIVKAVQEQQEIIETQKTELEQLKSELEKYKMLEERIKALEQK